MKYTVKIAGKTFEVEIDDINKRPIIARVDGQEFEVSPQISPVAEQEPAKPKTALTQGMPSSPSLASKVLTSPLPGTVIEVFIKPGDEVEAGQVLLIIDAMKMKNSIRSVRNGTVAVVHISGGQTVAHKQALVEFTE